MKSGSFEPPLSDHVHTLPVMHTHCLNCTYPLTGHYCAHCGQKASTHRYSVRHFVAHDLVHGIWHVDKGLLFTVKELFVRPGHSVRTFIAGKRAGHFNYITLIVLVIGISAFLAGFTHLKLSDIFPAKTREMMSVIERFSMKYPKLVPLVTIPFSSLFSFLWFRKAGLNAAEHIVMNAYKASAELIIGLLFSIILIFYQDKQVLYQLYSGMALLISAYGVWFYYQFFSVYNYSKTGRLLRSIMIPVSIVLFYMLIGFLSAFLAYKTR